jgi:hypothetical protein
MRAKNFIKVLGLLLVLGIVISFYYQRRKVADDTTMISPLGSQATSESVTTDPVAAKAMEAKQQIQDYHKEIDQKRSGGSGPMAGRAERTLSPEIKKLIQKHYGVDDVTLQRYLHAPLGGPHLMEALELAEMKRIPHDELLDQMASTRGGFHGVRRKHDVQLIELRRRAGKRLRN